MSGNAPKILVVALVVIAVLFFVGIGVGAGGGIGSISLDGVIGSLSSLFPSPSVALDDISASPSGCLDRSLQRILVSKLDGCQLQIAASSANVRALKLRIEAGASVHYTLTVTPPQSQPMTAGDDLPKQGKDQLTLDFYTSGGTLTLDSCATSASACVIDIAQ